MLETLQRERRTDEEQSAGDQRPVAQTSLFRLGRAIFGGILAFLALDNLRNLEGRIQYAEAKGTPLPKLSVPTSSAGLLLGSLGVALWRLPSTAAAAVAWFFGAVTPVMHDFWNSEDPEQRQQEFLHFLKNSALFGAALVFLKVGERTRRQRRE